MRVIAVLFFCIVYLGANDFSKKQIIKLEVDETEFVDLGQSKTISESDKGWFDSSKEIKKNEIYLEYEDTDKDFVLLVGFNKDLHFEFEDLNVSGEELTSDIFISFIEEVSLSRSIDLLNRQNNDIYQDFRNFSLLTQNPKHKLFDVSSLLNYTVSFDRIYNKTPEYVIFIVLDECNIKDEEKFFFTTQTAYISLQYKILKLGENVIVDDKSLDLFVSIPKRGDLQKKYYSSTHQVGLELKRYFSKLARKLD